MKWQWQISLLALSLSVNLGLQPGPASIAAGPSATVAQAQPTPTPDSTAALAEAERLEQQADHLYEQGKYAEAIPLAQKVLTLRRQWLPPDHRRIRTALNNLGLLQEKQGRYPAAESLFLEAITLDRQATTPDPLQLATHLNNLADLYRTQGRYAEAVPLFQEALAIKRDVLPPKHFSLALGLNNLALLYKKQGYYSEAAPLYEEAIAIIRQILPPDHPNLAISLDNLANLYKEQGRYRDAQALYEEALAIFRKALPPGHPDLAVNLSNLASLYYRQDRYRQAEPLYKEALAIYRQALPPEHPSIAISLDNLAVLYRSQGRHSEAEPLYKEALAIFRKALPPGHPHIAINLNNLAVLYDHLGRSRDAERLYQEAIAIERQALPPDHPNLVISLNNLAGFYWAQNQVSQTLTVLAEGLDIEEINLARNLAVGTEQQKRDYLALFQRSTNRALSAHLKLAPQNRQATRLALTTLLRRKGRILDVLGQSFQRLRQTLDPDLQGQLDQLATLQTQLSNVIARGPGNQPLAQYQRQQRTLTTHISDIEAALSQASAELGREFQPVEIEAVQRTIPTDAALVEFILYRPFDPRTHTADFGPPRYAVYVLQADGTIRWADLGPAQALDALIAAFRQAVEDPSLPAPMVRQAARTLDLQLMQPVRTLVGEATHLLIAPDGPLNLIPFEALVDQNNRYLLETYRFTYLTSGRDLLRLQDAAPPAQAPLLMVNPTYDQPGLPARQPAASTRGNSQRSSDLAQVRVDPLEATLTEGQSISTLLPQARLHTGTEATEAMLKQSPSPSILHIATHGFFLKDVPPSTTATRQGNSSSSAPTLPQRENPLLRSGLALAGFNLRRDPEDGVLTALEVSGLDLRGTQMVVLSACQTGAGEVVNGEGVYGLRRAFTLAGAKSQLMSLWTVSDTGTKDLMVTYYQHLQQGQARGEALRQVQLAMLAGDLTADTGQGYDHPYYWAAFVRVGDWRPIAGF